MKVKGQILICTAIMLNDHSNPYIESTTVLSDKQNILITNLQEEHPLGRTCLCSSIYKIFPSTSCVHSFSLWLVCNKKSLFGLGIIIL